MDSSDTPQGRTNDMLRFDTLGPLTRAVIRDCPNELQVGQMVAAAPNRIFGDHGPDDRLLAQWLRGEIHRRYGSPLESFVLKRGNRHGGQSQHPSGDPGDHHPG